MHAQSQRERMWMVDDNLGKEPTDDQMFGRKLRPLVPRLDMSTPSWFCTSQNPNILPVWNHPIGVVSDYGVKREMHTVPLVSTRWNPTPEQLQALEEMYRRGTRTPSAEQIQQIAARLRRFGKIEGKNVFYWFQNHKARERQKKRRQLESLAGNKVYHNESTSGTKQIGLSRRYSEIENHKKLATPSNCCTPSEDSVSMHGSVIAECKKLDVWTGFHQKKLQTAKSNEITSWKLDLSSCNNNALHTIYNSRIKASSSSIQENTKPFNYESLIKENRTTLQLFPVGSVDFSDLDRQEEIHHVSTAYIGIKSKPNEFIEFLPTLK